ncbi:MAG: aspartate-semialdehyde dehydrogenase [Clostridia bacterium]
MNEKITIAIVGATGAVGRTLIKLLEKADLPIEELILLASSRSAGRKIDFLGQELVVEETTDDSFYGVDIAFFCAGGNISEMFAQKAVDAGAIVIDNSSYFRLDESVPLVIPEVNPEALKKHKGIIANPNCSTIIMLMALKPLLNFSNIKRVVFATYQAVSGGGNQAISELEGQIRSYVEGENKEAKVLPVANGEKHYQIAFNLLPQVDVFDEGYYTKEEWKMIKETHKILDNSNIGITGTCVRVPVFWCHAEALNIEFETKIDREKAIETLDNFPGVKVLDNPDEQMYPMPIDYYNDDNVYVGRIREDNSIENGLNIWVVGNQLRKGAATNALQIAMLLANKGLLKKDVSNN